MTMTISIELCKCKNMYNFVFLGTRKIRDIFSQREGSRRLCLLVKDIRYCLCINMYKMKTIGKS